MQRHERLQQDVKIALSDIIRNDVKEPSVTGLISVTDVKITPDQKYAKVYVSILNSKSEKDTMDTLKRSAGFVRTLIAKRINLRITPELIFEKDDSMEYGARIEKVIEDLKKIEEYG